MKFSGREERLIGAATDLIGRTGAKELQIRYELGTFRRSCEGNG